MGDIKEVLAEVELKKPAGWNPKDGQFNLPFSVELCENFHIHWQDVRLEMMADDFDSFACAIAKAHEKWVRDGRPKTLDKTKWYGAWVDEEELDFSKDRGVRSNKKGQPCHHFRIFPRTQSRKLHMDSKFVIELQKHGWLHIHHKNFRLELDKNSLRELAKAFNKAVGRMNESTD